MIISLKKSIRSEEQEHLIQWLESQGVRTHISEGEFQTIIGLVGDTTRIDIDLIRGLEFVDGGKPEVPSGGYSDQYSGQRRRVRRRLFLHDRRSLLR